MEYEVQNINELDERTLQKKEGKVARKSFSRIFSGLVLYSLIAGIAIIAIELIMLGALGEEGMINALMNPYVIWGINVLVMYVIAFPLFMLYIKPVPARRPLRDEKIGCVEFSMLFLVSVAVMQLGNVLSNILVTLITRYTGYVEPTTTDTISEAPFPVIILVVVIIGPIIEELIFRRAIIDRLGKYGEKMAIAVSSVAFGIFHGNLNQLIYATLLGFILGNMYVKSGKIRYPIMMHMLVNMFGTVPAILMQRADEYLAGTPDTASQDYLVAKIVSIAVPIIFFACIGLGIVVLLRAKKTGLFEYYYECEIDLSPMRRLRCVLLNAGAIEFLLLYGLTIASTLVPLEQFLM